MGSSSDDEKAFPNEQPQHIVDIPYDYWISRFPITNEQFALFSQFKNKEHPVVKWEKKMDHPVVWVSSYDIFEYCYWLSQKLDNQVPKNMILRLPTEAEWEKSARGPDGRLYPWGNTFDRTKCNIFETGVGNTTPVGLYSPQGDSIYGCSDITGNVWELTNSFYKPYPYDLDDGREDEKYHHLRVQRGGSFIMTNAALARCAYRSTDSYHSSTLDGGFRVAISIMLPKSL